MWAWQPYDTPVNQLAPGATISHCHHRRTPGFLVGTGLRSFVYACTYDLCTANCM